jgi:hypothetical protein
VDETIREKKAAVLEGPRGDDRIVAFPSIRLGHCQGHAKRHHLEQSSHIEPMSPPTTPPIQIIERIETRDGGLVGTRELALTQSEDLAPGRQIVTRPVRRPAHTR